MFSMDPISKTRTYLHIQHYSPPNRPLSRILVKNTDVNIILSLLSFCGGDIGNHIAHFNAANFSSLRYCIHLFILVGSKDAWWYPKPENQKGKIWITNSTTQAELDVVGIIANLCLIEVCIGPFAQLFIPLAIKLKMIIYILYITYI